MEVVSILGAAASVATVIEVSTTCINRLLDLRTKYKIADLNVQVSIAQLSTLKAALAQISTWTCQSSELIPYNLEMDLNISLGSCKALIDGLNDHLRPFKDDDNTTSLGRKTKFLLNGREWSHLQTLLGHQVSAIQLFLTTMQCRTQVEQEILLRRPESCRIICSVRDDSSSLLWLRDENSSGTQRSICTETSEFLDVSFVFDPEVLQSRSYLSAIRSNMKRAVRGSYQPKQSHGFPQRRSTSELDDTATTANYSRWMRSTRPAAFRRGPHESSESNTMFSEARQDQASDTSSISSPISPISGSSAHIIRDLGRRKILHMPSLLRSKESLTVSTRISARHMPRKQQLEDGHDETHILVVGNDKETAVILERSMILACGYNYTKAQKASYRNTILQTLVADMKRLLITMRNLGIPLTEECSEWHAHILGQSVEGDWELEPSVITTAVATLWNDPGVVETFNRSSDRDWCGTREESKYFFEAIRRISAAGYEPSLDDIARASTNSHNVQDVLIPRKSAGQCYQYRFINNIGIDSDGNQWVYTSDDVSLLIHVVDTTTYDDMIDGNVTNNHFMQALELFQRVCSSRWLAETPVLVLLSNLGELSKKLQNSPIHHSFPDFSGQPHDILHVRRYFRDLYLRVDRKYDMRVWVEFVDSGATAAVGKTVISIIDKILTEKSLLSYGLQ